MIIGRHTQKFQPEGGKPTREITVIQFYSILFRRTQGWRKLQNSGGATETEILGGPGEAIVLKL